jgi:predicted nucleic acid-binding protein
MKILCDTGFLSRYFSEANEFVQQAEAIGKDNITVSIINRIELLNWLSGYRTLTKPKRARIATLITALPVLHINEGISMMAAELADADINARPGDLLIAATALYYDLPVLTLNTKHFKQQGVRLVAFR